MFWVTPYIYQGDREEVARHRVSNSFQDLRFTCFLELQNVTDLMDISVPCKKVANLWYLWLGLKFEKRFDILQLCCFQRVSVARGGLQQCHPLLWWKEQTQQVILREQTQQVNLTLGKPPVFKNGWTDSPRLHLGFSLWARICSKIILMPPQIFCLVYSSQLNSFTWFLIFESYPWFFVPCNISSLVGWGGSKASGDVFGSVEEVFSRVTDQRIVLEVFMKRVFPFSGERAQEGRCFC